MANTMTSDRATVTCADCGYAESFTTLQDARVALDDHRDGTGHRPDWEIHDLASGVQRAGADAGVCGRSECANADSPLIQFSPGVVRTSARDRRRE